MKIHRYLILAVLIATAGISREVTSKRWPAATYVYAVPPKLEIQLDRLLTDGVSLYGRNKSLPYNFSYTYEISFQKNPGIKTSEDLSRSFKELSEQEAEMTVTSLVVAPSNKYAAVGIRYERSSLDKNAASKGRLAYNDTGFLFVDDRAPEVLILVQITETRPAREKSRLGEKEKEAWFESIKKRANQTPEPMAPSGRGSS